MLPKGGADIADTGIKARAMPSGTFSLDFARRRVSGRTDGREAMKQAIYLILGTERYTCPIYSRGYGTELEGLVGRPIQYVLPELKRRITEALTQDDRVTGVDGWEFDTGRGTVTAAFTVHTIWGDVEMKREVAV